MAIAKPLLSSFIFLFLLSSCSNESKNRTKPVFYHWKNNFELSNIEKINLSHLGSKKLFVRFFDVIWDESSKEALPKGELTIYDALNDYEVTPTIYLDHEIFNNLSEEQCKTFAQLVAKKVKEMAISSNITPKEISVDCNWEIKSQNGYFLFLNQLKSNNNWSISCGINSAKLNLKRYRVPPIDYVILQLYKQSISSKLGRKTFFDLTEMEAVSKMASNYPLKMSLAFPLFSRAIHTRNKSVLRILPRREYTDFMNNENFDVDTPYIKVWKENRFKNFNFNKNDLIYMEQANEKENYKVLELILKNKGGKQYKNLLFFDLDDYNMVHYDYSSIEQLTSLFTEHYER